MKALKVFFVLFVVYVGIVVLFESLLGYFQPVAGSTMVVTTFDDNGRAFPRVVQRLESDNQLYVAVNHWPRAWYRRILRNPTVQITYGGSTGSYRAVQLTGADFDRVNSENSLPLLFRIVTGFPPRHLFRLESG